MRRRAIVVAGFSLVLLCATSAAPAVRARLVYRVDRVSAVVENQRLVIAASGAVSSGGYSHLRLRLKPGSRVAHVLILQFLADPPPPNRLFVQELLPVSAQTTTVAPRGSVAAVAVASQSNEITSEIRR